MSVTPDYRRILRDGVPWLPTEIGDDPVVSTRIRLARNLQGYRFPGRAEAAEAAAVATAVAAAAAAVDAGRGVRGVTLSTLTQPQRRLLLERHLLSPQQCVERPGTMLVVGPRSRWSLMINEEDHVRLQVLRPGLALDRAWQVIEGVDAVLGRHLDYAFSAELGFLTACPSNVGTGLRASVMLHLPGLVLAREMERCIQAMAALGLAVRGLFGEGSEAIGDLYQISNQATLGETEAAIIGRLAGFVERLREQEKNVRAVLLEREPDLLFDYVGRAFGIMSHARLMTSQEALQQLSALRLGVQLGMFTELDIPTLNELMVWSQPGHLQEQAGAMPTDTDRDAWRAEFLRRRLMGGKSTKPR